MNTFANIKTITKRELGAYFSSPLAYVFLVIFLLLCGFFTKFIRFHHITVRLTKEVASGSFAAARAKASRASSSETPSISYRTLPG